MFKNHAIGGNDSSVIKSQAVLPQDPSSVSTTYVEWLTATKTPDPENPMQQKIIFWSLKHLHTYAVLTQTCTCMHTKKHTEIFKNKLSKLTQKS